MDLNFGPEYTKFREEVNDFCKEYSGVLLESSKIPMSDELSSGQIKMKRSDWQKLLIEKGYFARSIPKEYGGYGGETDIIKNRIIAEEFAKNNTPPPMGGQGIDMLVPTLLELGTEEQKKNISNQHYMAILFGVRDILNQMLEVILQVCKLKQN